MSGFPLAPWHMWGSTVRVSTSVDIASGTKGANQQLLRVNYKRPETWSFFFGAKLLTANSVGPTMQVIVLIDLIVGVGRTNFITSQQGNQLIMPAFRRFEWTVAAGVAPATVETNVKYATQGSGPPVNDTDATSVPTIEWIPAEDIQVQIRQFQTGTAGSSATSEVTGWVAPRTHVRPDWFVEKGEQFRGKEIGGT